MTHHPRRVGTQQVVLQLRPVRCHDDKVSLHRLRHFENDFVDRTLADDVLNGDVVGHFLGDKILEPDKDFFADSFSKFSGKY